MAVQDMKTEAMKIEKYLAKQVGATVQEISAKLEIAEEHVVQILDQWHIHENGSAEHKGEGMGGGWAPARQFEAELQAQRDNT